MAAILETGAQRQCTECGERHKESVKTPGAWLLLLNQELDALVFQPTSIDQMLNALRNKRIQLSME